MNRTLASAMLLGIALSTAGASAAVANAAGVANVANVVGVAGAGQARAGGTGSAAAATGAHPVVLVGIPGLLWTDISRQATPALWQLAEDGSVGDLIVHAVEATACPADGWLTLNAGARAMVRRTASAQCPRLPAVQPNPPAQAGGVASAAAAPVPADLPSMPALVRYNKQFSYNPNWGLLATAAGPGGCATAIGPGAALALAGPGGRVTGYLRSAAAASAADFTRCPLTVVDLGALPAGAANTGAANTGAASVGASARAAAVRAGDRAVARIRAGLPPGTILVVAGPSDGARPHLHPIMVAGPGYGSGMLDSAATRQPGLVTLTDLTPTLLRGRGVSVPPDAVGSQITHAGRSSLHAAIRGLIGQDTAAQVYAGTFGWFFAAYGLADGVAFAAIGLLLRGAQQERRRRRAALWRLAGTFAVAVPAASYLASVVSWWLLPHPAVWLYGLTACWTVVLGAVALAGPWRRDPIGPLGLVAAVTAAVIAADVATGSRLQLGTPFGLSALVAGRFYGIGNNAVVIYATAGIFAAAWLGMTVLRRGERRRRAAILTVAAVALVVTVVSGWPGFGAKVGGTFAMVPGFLIVLMGVANVKITARRAALAAACGAALVIAFAAINYLVPATGQSDIGSFAGQVLHGGAGGTLSRKVSSNVGSLTTSAYALIVPPVIVVAGLILVRPSWLAIKTMPLAWAARPLLRVTLAALWLVAVLTWFAEDSGVTVVAAALPFALPFAIAAGAAVAYPGPGQAGVAAAEAPARQAILDLPP